MSGGSAHSHNGGHHPDDVDAHRDQGHAPPDGEDGAPLGGALRRLSPIIPFLKPHRRLFAGAVVSGIVHHASVIASGVVAADMVGRAVTGAPAAALTGGFQLLAVLLVPLVIAPWLETQIAHTMAFRALVDVRDDVFDAVERVAPAGLADRRAGDVGSTAMADVELLEIFFAHTISQLVAAVVVPLLAVLAVAFYHPLLAVVLLPVLATAAVVPARLRRRSLRSGQQLRERLGDLHADAVDTVQGLREILTTGSGERQLDGIDALGVRLGATQEEHARRTGTEAAVSDAVVTGGLLVVLGAAAWLVGAGRLDAALLPAAVVLGVLAFRPVVAVVDVARELAAVAAAADRVGTLLNAPTTVAPTTASPDHTSVAPAHEPGLEFKDVSFRYAPALPLVLDRVSFTVQAGETVALVGHSGAGKSTCGHLALRLWDVEAGQVRLGGVDVRLLPDELLRQTVSAVPQDAYLFNRSLLTNIGLGRPEASEEDVRAAAVQAQADGFVTDFPDGYDTVAGEFGAAVSGGQRQRLAIARAILVDPPVVVLDEAVSNLDTESERDLRHAMHQARPDRATLVIAHRLSTIVAADRVVLLQRGRVVDSGTHDHLLTTSPAYRELLAGQSDLIHDRGPSDAI